MSITLNPSSHETKNTQQQEAGKEKVCGETMKYRPDAVLDLRTQTNTLSNKTTFAAAAGRLLPWLRTVVIDRCSSFLRETDIPIERQIAAQRNIPYASIAVQHVILRQCPVTATNVVQDYLTSLHVLIHLDLRCCAAELTTDTLLTAVATAHPGIRRLYLPAKSPVTQEVLNLFSQLEGWMWNGA